MNPHDDAYRHIHKKATVDRFGNIIIPCEYENSELEFRPLEKENPPLSNASINWEITSDDSKDSLSQGIHISSILSSVQKNVHQFVLGIVKEGKNQYTESIQSLHTEMISTPLKKEPLSAKIAQFLSQPVWIVQKNKKTKQYSRGTLFLLDVFRFGGTFGVIFGALFVSLNFQSFAQIASPYLNPLEHTQQVQGMVSTIDATLKEHVLRSPSLAVAGSSTNGDLLAFLPEVGPPDNRIIIPKLGLNVPLVTPSYDSLLAEDWSGVEEDIQAALQQGVVHYPGTARPGQAGNFFVTGHSSYYPWAPGAYKTVFARLHELDVGDEYWVYYGGDKHRYIVTNKKEVRPSNVDVLDQPTNKRISTLMTCTPVGTTLRRLILTANEVDIHTGIELKPGELESRPVHTISPAALPI